VSGLGLGVQAMSSDEEEEDGAGERYRTYYHRRSGVFPGAFNVDDEDEDDDSLPPRTEEPSSMPTSPTSVNGVGESSKMGANSTGNSSKTL